MVDRRLPTRFSRICAVAVLACGAAACGGGDGGGGGGGASIEDFCASMDRVNVNLDSRGFFESAENDDVAPALEAVKGIDPPEEVASEWATVIEGTERAAELERGDGGRFEKTAESERAADRILQYVEVQCTVDLTS
ncbi:hypothetical protein ACN3XK_55455 [Actinomadura welshii]